MLYFAPLTGLPISYAESEDLRVKRPLAVMIDNIITATPQTGLDRADVVIEALVEGGITRYMAIFHSQEAEVIEPVRSARTPFLYWALEYDAYYAHVGSAERDGPADAGAQIYEWGVAGLDLGSNPLNDAYIRNPMRLAPHNVQTSSSKLRQKASQLGHEREPAFFPLTFTSVEGLWSGMPAPAFSVRFGGISKLVAVWEWHPESARYLRSQFGEPQHDPLSGQRLGFTNVIVQYAGSEVVDSNGHVLIDLIGEGRAQVFNNGQVIEATWSKAERNARTVFLGSDGTAVPLLAGPTWIEVVPFDGGATIH